MVDPKVGWKPEMFKTTGPVLVLDVLEMEAAMSDAYIFLVAVVSRGIARWHVLMLGSLVEAAGRLARTTFHRFLPHSRLLCHYDYD